MTDQVVQGYTQLALADAQSITVLRAIQKGNAPSLVAALAHDTANMYQAAAQAFKQVASTSKLGSKQGRYAEWKLLVFQGYMYAFTGTVICAKTAASHDQRQDFSLRLFNRCDRHASAHGSARKDPEHSSSTSNNSSFLFAAA